MKMSRAWLNDYVDLSRWSDQQIADRLTEIGHAVESIERQGDGAVFEIEFTTNRIDAMSHRGLARELGAAFGIAQAPHAVDRLPAAPAAISVSIEAPELCSRFSGAVLRGVTVRPSTPEVQKRLEEVGLRPINNVVDATNYVMMALGHPLHAYDLNDIHGGKIIVRRGEAGEKIRTLDGADRVVSAEVCIIADGERAIGLGGVIGGENSEINTATRDIFIECAWFDPSATRRTARRLGIKTDASYRFERGVDPNDGPDAVMSVVQMIQANGGGTLDGSVDVVARAHQPTSITLRDARLVEASAGAIAPQWATALFQNLMMGVQRSGEESRVVIPSFRGDLHEEIDLIEEALRFFGFNAIPPSLPRLTTGDVRHEPLADAEETVRDLLVRYGLSEVITYSFVHPAHDSLFSEEAPVALSNALNENLSVMRTTLFSGLLEAIAHNRSYGTRDGALFEVGRSYHRASDGLRERRVASFALFGHRPSGWGEAKRNYDYFEAKGILEALATQLHLTLRVEPAEQKGFRSGHCAAFLGKKRLATAGLLRPELLQRFGIKGDVVVAEIDLDQLVAESHDWKMAPVSRFPGVPMVIGMFHPPSLAYQTIIETIESLKIPYLQEVGLWDRFVPSDGSNQVKTALGLWYQASDRSLTQEEVAQAQRNLSNRIAEALPVRIISSEGKNEP